MLLFRGRRPPPRVAEPIREIILPSDLSGAEQVGLRRCRKHSLAVDVTRKGERVVERFCLAPRPRRGGYRPTTGSRRTYDLLWILPSPPQEAVCGVASVAALFLRCCFF